MTARIPQFACNNSRFFIVARLYSTNARSKVGNIKVNEPQQKTTFDKFNLENESLFGPLLKGNSVDKNVKNQEEVKEVAPNKPLGKHPFFPLSLNQNSTQLELKSLAKQLLIDTNISTKIPSVTTILQKTMSDENAAVLERWRNEMIKKLGIDGFAQYTKETFATGHALHKNIYHLLSGTAESQLNIETNIKGYWKSISSIFPKISDVLALEKKLTHPYLSYVGVIDCVAKYKDEIVLIEWKTSQKPKPTIQHTYDNPVQLAAYLGAWNFNPDLLEIEKCIIVISYPNGKTCHIHEMDRLKCHQAWTSWLSRLSEYYLFESSKVLEVTRNN